jgi:hypothetical protein
MQQNLYEKNAARFFSRQKGIFKLDERPLKPQRSRSPKSPALALFFSKTLALVL